MAPASLAAVVLAHSSGFSWDEALLVMLPIAAIAAVLFLVNARVKKLAARRSDAPTEAESAEDSPAGT